jgi:hypothetical protein
MSYAKMVDQSLVAFTVSTRAPLRWPAFIMTIVAIQDAFQEALDMRRAAHSRYRLSDE